MRLLLIAETGSNNYHLGLFALRQSRGALLGDYDYDYDLSLSLFWRNFC